MTDPVCGALTHKRTPCQNTLVTGCGLCPVHASQLRAANTPFKHIAKSRRKKSHSSNSSSQHAFLPRQQYLAHALLQEGFLYNLPVPQHHAMNDATAADDAHILDILKADPIVVSPVTPKTNDSSRHLLFHDEQPLVDLHSAHENDLQPPPDPFLLEEDLPIDLPVPKFD